MDINRVPGTRKCSLAYSADGFSTEFVKFNTESPSNHATTLDLAFTE